MCFIQYMVCSRDIRAVRQELGNLGLRVLNVRLGAATVAGLVTELEWARIREDLVSAGFMLLESPQYALAAQVKQTAGRCCIVPAPCDTGTSF